MNGRVLHLEYDCVCMKRFNGKKVFMADISVFLLKNIAYIPKIRNKTAKYVIYFPAYTIKACKFFAGFK